MSAIFGIFRLDKEPVHKHALSSLNRALKPYGKGPDELYTDRFIGLGQRFSFTSEDLLPPQTLSQLAPPSPVLVFDGRLDNRSELIPKLWNLSTTDGSPQDRDLVTKAFIKWGPAAFTRLIGVFALALWDSDRQCLHLVRSALSAPPLFYVSSAHYLAFASMPKGLFALPDVPRQLDEQVLARYLAWEKIPPKRGFYKRILQLPRGRHLACTFDGLKMNSIWNFDLSSISCPTYRSDEVEAFGGLLEQVVKDQLPTHGPLGIMLSGGLDSSSVAAVAAPVLSSRGEHLKAFTEVPRPGFRTSDNGGYYADETPYVQALARQYDNLDLNLIRTDGHCFLENLDSFFEMAEVPFRNASNRVYYEAILSTARTQGLRTLLTGGSGNLTISWDGRGLLAELLRKGRWIETLLQARAMESKGLTPSAWRALLRTGLLPCLPQAITLWIDKLRWSHRTQHRKTFLSLVKPEFARAHDIDFQACQSSPSDYLRQPPTWRERNLEYLNQGGALFDSLSKGYEALFGIETRDPTTDQRLVEFCLSLPEESFLKDGVPRRLVRRAMQDRLPGSVLWNEKRGLQAADWLERLSAGRTLVEKTMQRITSCDLARRVLDLPRLQQYVACIPTPGGDFKSSPRELRTILDLGLMTGAFIAWFEEDK